MGETPMTKGENEALMAEAGHLWGAEVVSFTRGTDDECQALIVPKGREVVSMKKLLDENRLNPERKRGTSMLLTLESFIDFVNRHRDAGSALFATDKAITAVLNYHGAQQRAGETPDPSGGMGARWGDHRGFYPYPFSTEWKKWTEYADKKLDQKTFAELIEDRLNDVLNADRFGATVIAFAKKLGFTLADAQEMLTLSRGLSVRADVRVTSAMNLSSGEVQFTYDESHGKKDGSGPLNAPGGFAIGIPVLEGGQGYILGVKLRYKLDKNSGEVSWTYSIQDKDAALKTALEDACRTAKEKTGLPLFYGSPEA
jgi:uncharacterized protein YfdQ (DUF2303 family)